MQRGTVALGNLLSPHGMNEYLTALILFRLGMKSFAQAIHLVSGEHVNQQNLRESLEEFREKQSRMDLGKMPTEHRNNISKAMKGKKGGKLSEEHTNNISKAMKGGKLSDKHRNNISKALKGKKGVKRSTDEKIAIGLRMKISRVKKAIDERMKYAIYEYECKKDMKSDYKSM